MVEYFIRNKYTHWYFQIINKARERGVPEDYFERHHVTPKSMGGNDKRWNIVKLTFREHYIVHWLLTKMTEGEIKRKMLYALVGMASSHRYKGRKITSWMYDQARRSACEAAIRGKLPDDKKNNWLSKLRDTYAKKYEEECGNADWRKCHFCQQYDAQENLYINKNIHFHRKCRNDHTIQLGRARRRRNLILRKDSSMHSRILSIKSKESYSRKKKLNEVIQNVNNA